MVVHSRYRVSAFYRFPNQTVHILPCPDRTKPTYPCLQDKPYSGLIAADDSQFSFVTQ
jgi:hypothetical protein